MLSRVQGAVDRRFNRAKYDAELEVDAFAARLRDLVDPQAATADLVAVVHRTVAPARVGMWVGGHDEDSRREPDMTWFQRVTWILLVGMAVLAIVLLMGRELHLDTDDIIIPTFGVMGLIGAWISQRRPSSPIGWLFLAAASAASMLMWSGAVVDETLATGAPWEGPAMWALLWTNVAWYIVIALVLVYVPLLFPDGPLSPTWRRIVIGLAFLQGTFVLMTAVAQHLEPTEGVVVINPLALPTPVLENAIGNMLASAGLALLPVGLALGLVSLVMRHRRAGEIERLQLRWFVAAVTLLLLSVLATMLASAARPDDAPSQVLVEIAFGLSLLALPIACAIAVLRYRLYDIDRIVSRTVSYLIVSLLVLGMYALVVTSVSALLPESNAVAVAGATLAAAAVFRPVMRRVQGVVDRRFNRARFDAEREVDAFAGRLQDAVDPGAAAADLSALVQRTLQPAAVGLWTKGAGS